MKRIGIEALLTWTYTRELPKDAPKGWITMGGPTASSWDAMNRYAALGTVIDGGDVRNRYGVTPDFTAFDPPHADALAVFGAVAGLDAIDMLDLPADWYPISDLGELGIEGLYAAERALDRLSEKVDGERRLKVKPRRLIEKHAVLGGAPEWRADVPERKFVLDAAGRPAWFRQATVVTKVGDVPMEIDGYNPRRRRPFPDAYRKTYLDPDPVFAAVERGEYELWRASLDIVTDAIAGRLADHVVESSLRPYRPWEDGEPVEPRVLADLSRPAGRDRIVLPARSRRTRSKRDGC